MSVPRAVAGSALLAAGAGLTVLVATPRTRALLHPVDERWYALMQRTRPAAFRAMSHTLDRGFGTVPDWSARVLVTAVLVRQRRWRALAGWSATIVLGEACIGPIKSAVRRPRPLSPRTVTSQSSYPSGHAIAAATTAPGVVLALLPPGRTRRWALGGALAVAAATAVSRTDLNAHWLYDCLGGFSLGAGFALTAPVAVEVLADARAARPRPPRRASRR